MKKQKYIFKKKKFEMEILFWAYCSGRPQEGGEILATLHMRGESESIRHGGLRRRNPGDPHKGRGAVDHAIHVQVNSYRIYEWGIT